MHSNNISVGRPVVKVNRWLVVGQQLKIHSISKYKR